MALHDQISNEILDSCLSSIPSRNFTTLRVISELEKKFPSDVQKIKDYSERNWRAVIGKAIKRFSVETNLIKQISRVEESPARWEKM